MTTPTHHGAHSYDYCGNAHPGAHGHTTMVLTLTITVAMLPQARLVPLPAALVLLLREAVLPHAKRAPVEVTLATYSLATYGHTTH